MGLGKTWCDHLQGLGILKNSEALRQAFLKPAENLRKRSLAREYIQVTWLCPQEAIAMANLHLVVLG